MMHRLSDLMMLYIEITTHFGLHSQTTRLSKDSGSLTAAHRDGC